ncbi:MAG: transporter substrate-binding domain-containing protein [Clostridia bacterium]|nr:transporter substrate-binding domain-containing protein [Clostridia bacterium]
MKNHRAVRAVSLLAVLVLLLLACLPTAAFAARTVRVGYVDMNGFLYTDAEGNHSGYLYDLLMECAQNTTRSYTFMRVSQEDCYDLLSTGQIDLCLGVTPSIPNKEKYIFTTEGILTAPLALVVTPESSIGYDDYTHLRGKLVGAYATGYSDSLLDMLLTGKGADVELKTDYTSREAMLTDLRSGVLDAAIINTDIGISGVRIIGRLGERILLGATLADGERSLLNELNEALRELRLSMPGLMEEIVSKYKMVDDNLYPSLTLDELAYIRRGRAVKVSVAEGDMLTADQAKKPIQQVLDEIALKTGLTFSYVVRENSNAALEAVRAGKADIMLGFNNDYRWAQQRGVRQTGVYLDSTYRALRKPDVMEIRTVAVPEGSYIAFRLEQEKSYNLLYYPDAMACIRAVQNDEADSALCWTPDAEQALYELGNHGLVYSDRTEYGGDVSIAVSKMSSSRLLPVLNKTISSIRPQRFRTIALPLVSDVYNEQQHAERQRLTLVMVMVFVALAAGFIALTVWITRRLRHAMLQVNSRRDYLRTVAEEIRRPSQTILGVAAGGGRLTRSDTLQALHSAGGELGDLAAEIEVMNQLDDRTFALAPIPVRPETLFGRLADVTAQQTADRDVNLQLHKPEEECPVIMLDEARYRRVFLNLMDNALRRTDAGGTIQLAFALERDRQQKNRMLVIASITDDGAMLSKQFVKRIAEDPKHDTERTLGLRLMTAKRLVKAMGGEISVHQRPNAGMKIRVQIPAELAEPLEIMSLSRGVYSEQGLLAGRNILLAEENPITAQLLYSLLVNEGAHVDLVENGQQVLDHFIGSAPSYYHAILTDITLPGLSGLEAAESIRDLPRRDGCSVLIVGMRSGTPKVNATKAMNLILPKPVNTTTLCRQLHTWLGEQAG